MIKFNKKKFLDYDNVKIRKQINRFKYFSQ